MPRSRRGRTYCIAAVCGTARNAKSASMASTAGFVNAISVKPVSWGWTRVSGMPSCRREVATVTSAEEWEASRRTRSPPAYPEAPTMAISMRIYRSGRALRESLYRMIFAIESSRMSSAPAAFSSGISRFTSDFCTTVSTEK